MVMLSWSGSRGGKGLPFQLVAVFVAEDDAHPRGHDVVGPFRASLRALTLQPRGVPVSTFIRVTGDLAYVIDYRSRSFVRLINLHETQRTLMRSPFSIVCTTSVPLVSEGRFTCIGSCANHGLVIII